MIPFYETPYQDLRIFRSLSMAFPAHLHYQLELIYVEDGVLEVQCGRKLFRVRPGEFIAVFPNTVHSYSSSPEFGEASCILVICDPSLTGSYLNHVTQKSPVTPLLAADRVHRDISYAMESLLREGEDAPRELHRAYIQLILARYIPHMELVKNAASSDESIRRVIQYVTEQYHTPITLEGMAREVGLSKYHLSRIFSGKLNTTFTGYLNSFRLALAQNLLDGSNRTILQICFDCGFESQRTFNRAFKQAHGLSPREYRNRARNQDGLSYQIVETPAG